MKIVGRTGILVAASALTVGCQPHPPVVQVSPGIPTAYFNATTGSGRGTLNGVIGAGSAPPPCLHEAHFTGVAYAGASDLRVLLTSVSVSVVRHNDKYSDALSLRVEVADRRHVLGYGSNIEYRLGPTVDSAGPSFTTWQNQDTIRLLLPWTRSLSPRWLTFFVNYRAVTHGGEVSDCGALLVGDTLRFAASDSVE